MGNVGSESTDITVVVAEIFVISILMGEAGTPPFGWLMVIAYRRRAYSGSEVGGGGGWCSDHQSVGDEKGCLPHRLRLNGDMTDRNIERYPAPTLILFRIEEFESRWGCDDIVGG